MSQLDIGLVAHNIRRRDGQGRVCIEVAKALVRAGHKVSAYSWTCDDQTRAMVSWVRIPHSPPPLMLEHLSFVGVASAVVSRRQHDVVFSMGACVFPRHPMIYYAAFTQAGWIATRPQDEKLDLYHRAFLSSAAWLERATVARARCVLAISDQVGHELQPFMRRGAAVEIVPGGVDRDEFPAVDEERRANARSELGLRNEDFVLALVGEFATGRKGLHVLASAVSLGEDQNELILIHGEGPVGPTRERMARLGLVDRVRFVDPIVPVQTVMAASNAVAVPSSYEPFSLVALEAAASGLPVIISSRAGAAQHVLPAGAGVSIEPDDPESIRRAIDLVKTDSRGSEKMGLAGIEMAKRLQWPDVADMAAEAIVRHVSSN